MDRQAGFGAHEVGQVGGRRRLAVATMTLAVALLGAACSGASAAPAGTPSATATPDNSPASFTRWTGRQGYGGGSGVAEIKKGAHWLQENAFASDRQSWMEWWATISVDLKIWLEAHPATACWADMHQAVISDLDSIAAAFATMRTSVDAGGPIPPAAAADMVQTADHLFTLEPEPGCP